MIPFDKIFSLMRKELSNYPRPFVSEWAEIVNDPYSTLISCIISLRTKDNVTADASLRLLKKAKTPEQMVKLSEKEISRLIYPAGFYKTKAKTIRDISKTLIERYSSKVPSDFDDLLKLKGVGRKTAAITMVYGHKRADFIPVDVHVHVIANRLGWISTKTPEQTMDRLQEIVPKKYWYPINELFVRFGQNICLTLSPFCSRCPVSGHCKRIDVERSR